jgi:acetyl-CoA carboxylase biotin carboxyl carrier protein
VKLRSKKKGCESGGFAEPVYRQAPAAVEPPAGTESKTDDDRDDGPTITSPFVGTFYRAASPEAEPFVKAEQEVSRGQTLCIVEAMKLMNEIEAEHDCKIVEILVQNGDSVEYGQPLFRILPK